MNRKITLIAATAAAALAAGGVAVASGVTGGGGDEPRITGQTFDRASRAALDHVGGGRVTGTEAGDEEGAYEVEVTRGDGTEVDVHLDRDFQVLGTEDEGRDDDGPGDDDSDDRDDRDDDSD